MTDLSTTPAAALQEGRTSPIEPDSEGSQAQQFAPNGLLLLSEAADTTSDLDDSIDYFGVQGALARARLEDRISA